jgi:hypothetical protein
MATLVQPTSDIRMGPTRANELEALRWWRLFVTRHRLLAALIAATVATHIATVTGVWYHGIGLSDLNWPSFNGALLLPTGSATSQFWVGTAYHYATGIALGLLYAVALHPLMRWAFKSSTLANLSKALVFGIVLATISALWWVPALFPSLNAGFFSANLGWKVVVGIYLWHLIYGFNLGLLYNPLSPAEVAESPAA